MTEIDVDREYWDRRTQAYNDAARQVAEAQSTDCLKVYPEIYVTAVNNRVVTYYNECEGEASIYYKSVVLIRDSQYHSSSIVLILMRKTK